MKRIQSSSSSSVFNSVDLLTEILLRLPTKLLIQFRCVSKLWLSLISDPQFQSNHTLRRRNSLLEISGLYFKPISTGEYIGISLTGAGNCLPSLSFLESGFRVQQHCNGLLLCMHGKRLIVCNPTTKRFTEFHIPSDLYDSGGDAGLAFDPSKSLAFKVVVPASSGFGIFSSDTASWTTQIATKTSSHLHFNPCKFSDPVFCKGSIFWVHKHERTSGRLIQLDMSSYQLSPWMALDNGVKYINDFRGNLTLVFSERSCYQVLMPHISSYQPNAYKSFATVDTFDLNLLRALAKPGRVAAMFVTSHGFNDSKIVFRACGRILCYSTREKSSAVLYNLPDDDTQQSKYAPEAFSYRKVYPFAASLAPV